MSNQETVVSALERRIDMSVPLADIEKDVEARLKQMARTVKMPGFRPGKVPFRMVAQSYGQQARSEAIGAAVERVLGEQIRTLGLRVAGYPSIEPKDGTSTEALEFTAVFEVYPEVSIADVRPSKSCASSAPPSRPSSVPPRMATAWSSTSPAARTVSNSKAARPPISPS